MSNYIVLSDDYINDLFNGTHFGPLVDESVNEKRNLIAETLRNQLYGFWSGHTIYKIIVDGGFMKDSKTDQQKQLTALGAYFLEQHQLNNQLNIDEDF